jgi:hypothetical protein
MAVSRDEQRPRILTEDAPILAAEVLRRAAASPDPAPKGEAATPVFWRIFGTTVLSIAALVAVTLYQQLSGGIGDLRNECRSLSDACGDMVKKDEFNNRSLVVANSIKEAQANNSAAADLWKERALALERQIKANEDKYEQQARDMSKDLQRLHERLAIVESRSAPAAPAASPASARP